MTSVKYPEGHVLLRKLKRSYPIISHGEGLYLWDTDGKKYLDASGGAMVPSVGHGNKEVAHEIAGQMSRVAYVNGTHFTSQAMEDFATKLCAMAPEGLSRVAVLASGSEVVEAAVKFARQLWVERKKPKKSKFIARVPGYHGNTLYALSASAREHYKKFFAPLLSEIVRIPAPYEYRSPVPYQTQGADYYAGALEEAIAREGADTIAALLIEPIIGSSAGGSCPPPGYMERIQEICKKHEILIIADEVLCGSGRTGEFFASDHYGFKPDLMVLGKGINGGMMPVSAVIVKDEHLQEMAQGSGFFMHAQTYLQVPSAAATGLAVLNYFEKYKLVENCAKVGEYFHKKLQNEIAPLPFIGYIAGRGLLAGVEFVEDVKTKKPFDRSRKMVESFVDLAFKNGLILWPNSGQADDVNGDLVMLAPPLVVTKAQIDEIILALKSTVLEFFGGSHGF